MSGGSLLCSDAQSCFPLWREAVWNSFASKLMGGEETTKTSPKSQNANDKSSTALKTTFLPLRCWNKQKHSRAVATLLFVQEESAVWKCVIFWNKLHCIHYSVYFLEVNTLQKLHYCKIGYRQVMGRWKYVEVFVVIFKGHTQYQVTFLLPVESAGL